MSRSCLPSSFADPERGLHYSDVIRGGSTAAAHQPNPRSHELAAWPSTRASTSRYSGHLPIVECRRSVAQPTGEELAARTRSTASSIATGPTLQLQPITSAPHSANFGANVSDQNHPDNCRPHRWSPEPRSGSTPKHRALPAWLGESIPDIQRSPKSEDRHRIRRGPQSARETNPELPGTKFSPEVQCVFPAGQPIQLPKHRSFWQRLAPGVRRRD